MQFGKPKLLSLETTLTFGKHRGKTVKQIIDEGHWSYLCYIVEDTKDDLSEAVYEYQVDKEFRERATQNTAG